MFMSCDINMLFDLSSKITGSAAGSVFNSKAKSIRSGHSQFAIGDGQSLKTHFTL
jgi:hypothetical protein